MRFVRDIDPATGDCYPDGVMAPEPRPATAEEEDKWQRELACREREEAYPELDWTRRGGSTLAALAKKWAASRRLS